MQKLITILFLFGLSISGKSQTPNARCAEPVKLNILDSANYYNLSGYLYPLSLLFDGNTATQPVPPSGEKFTDYYHNTRGWRWDVDLRSTYYITNVKVYWGSSTTDTVNIWMSDSVYNGGSVAFARIRNINSTVWDITSYSTTPGWTDYVVNDSASKIRLQYKNGTYLGNPLPTDGVREIEVYGCRIGSVLPIFTTKKAQTTLAEKDGTNIAAEIHPVSLFTNKKWVRTYFERDYMDNENVSYPTNRYRYALFGGNPYPYNDSMKNYMGIFYWPTILGTSQYMRDTYGKPMEFMALDEPTEDPEDPASYQRAADFAWHISHLYGDDENAHLDTSYSKVYDYVSITGGPKPYANNTISAYEGDNERNGWWKYFGVNLGPIADVAKASAEKDGDQGRMLDRLGGTRMGVRNADDSLLFIMDGTAGIDVETLKARMYLSKMLRGEVMWDIVQGHEYFSKYDGAVTYTSNGQIGNRGTYPEDDSARILYNHMVEWGNRISGDTSLKYMTGEHGKDAVLYYPHDLSEVSANVTQYGPPPYVDGVALDSFECQALDIEIDRAEGWASGLVAMVQYLFHDLEVTTAPGYKSAYVSSGFVLHSLAKKPSWYRHLSQSNLLNGYVFDEVISYVNGGLVHYRGHKIGAPDSIVNYIRKADDTTGAGVAVSIDINTATQYELRQASYTSVNYSSSTASASGTISATATIIPKYYFTYEPSGANQSPTAAAGTDQTITLPTSSVTVDGSSSSDPDGTISTYEWTKTSGPVTYTIVSPNSASTNITGLVAGTYVFTLTVTDNDSATDTDTITITVNAEPSDPVIKIFKYGRKRVQQL
jgi:hypothetical protein